MAERTRQQGEPDYVVLDGPNFARWHAGADDALDVFGNIVSPDLPASKVKRSYSPPRRLVEDFRMIPTEGGV